MVIGKTIEEAMKIGPQEIATELGGLPPQKFHCSVLGDKALRAAAADYYRRKGLEHKITWGVGEIICNCLNVSKDEIEELVAHGVTEFSELQERTKLGTSCGECKPRAMELLEELRKKYYPQGCELEGQAAQ
jgi:nitrogen fixation NifU-like protein